MTVETRFEGDIGHRPLSFIRSYRSNGVPPFGVLAECAGGKGVSPYFTTSAGGALQIVLFGFAGLRISDNGLENSGQQLPSIFKRLEVKPVTL